MLVTCSSSKWSEVTGSIVAARFVSSRKRAGRGVRFYMSCLVLLCACTRVHVVAAGTHRPSICNRGQYVTGTSCFGGLIVRGGILFWGASCIGVFCFVGLLSWVALWPGGLWCDVFFRVLFREGIWNRTLQSIWNWFDSYCFFLDFARHFLL